MFLFKKIVNLKSKFIKWKSVSHLHECNNLKKFITQIETAIILTPF